MRYLNRVVLNHHTVTSLPGEVSDGRYRQAATAVGDGCRATMDAEGWIEEQDEEAAGPRRAP